MLRMARAVRVLRTGTDLEARLEEAETILQDRPPYNRAIKRRWRGWYLEIGWSDPFPRLRIVRAARHRGAQYFGPFWGRRIPQDICRLVEKICRLRTCHETIRPGPGASACIQHELALCSAPCIRTVGIDAYRAQVRNAARLLSSQLATLELCNRMEAARRQATGRLEFEEAARHQARLEWLEQLETYRFALEPDAGPRSWLVVLPGVEPDQRVVVPVARGRVLARRQLCSSNAGWRSSVEDACYAVRVQELRAASVFPPEAAVPSMLVTRWLQQGSPDGQAFDLDRYTSHDVVQRLDTEWSEVA
jgi:excinuclease UvrABC nuclease subunit